MAYQTTPVPSTRVITLPNLLTLLRLGSAPVVLWLIVAPVWGGPWRDEWALGVLAASGFTDYLDGRLARRWNQISRLGQLLDPAVDRLYILAILAGLSIREIIPVWLAGGIVSRDVFLMLLLPLLRRHGYGPWPVHFLGKVATFTLLCAFPLLLLGSATGRLAQLAAIFGWAFAIWGVALYWWAGVRYARQAWQLIQARGVVT